MAAMVEMVSCYVLNTVELEGGIENTRKFIVPLTRKDGHARVTSYYHNLEGETEHSMRS